MPNSVSSKKRLRQSQDRAALNKVKRSSMRTYVKRVQEAVAEQDKAKAEAVLPLAYQAIDKCAKNHVVHAHKAAHQKSQLARLVGSL